MKKILFLGIFFSLSLIIVGLSRSIYDLWKKQDLLISYQKQLENQKNQNQRLKQQLSTAQGANFVEEQARNNLFLVKPGEQDVIIPKELLRDTNSTKPIGDNRANWQKWFSLFF